MCVCVCVCLEVRVGYTAGGGRGGMLHLDLSGMCGEDVLQDGLIC